MDSNPHDPITAAKELIFTYHGEQKRKAGGKSFITHLKDVFDLVEKGFPEEANPELLAAALCHDLLEDTECTENEILVACGDKVLGIVKNVSNDPNLSWEEKKKDYLQRVSTGSREAQIICLCDKIANMRSLLEEYKIQKEKVWDNFNRGRGKKIWFEESCHQMLSEKIGQHPYLDLYADLIEMLNEPEENGLFDNPYISFKDDLPDENGKGADHYEIWLKNPDKVTYEVQMQTGGSVSCDEELLTIESEGIVELGKIDPEERLLLESGHIFGISDSTIWFRVWLNDSENNKKLIKFSVGKGYFNSEGVKVTEKKQVTDQGKFSQIL